MDIPAKTRQALHQTLDEALSADLTVMPRSHLTLMRLDIDRSARMDALFRRSPRHEDWANAAALVQTEIDLRPERPLMAKDLAR